jgi:hypothetical protein
LNLRPATTSSELDGVYTVSLPNTIVTGAADGTIRDAAVAKASQDFGRCSIDQQLQTMSWYASLQAQQVEAGSPMPTSTIGCQFITTTGARAHLSRCTSWVRSFVQFVVQ